MIGILDYGLGNILAFVNTYKRLHIGVKIIRIESDLTGMDKLILPGVGAFDHAMDLFDKSGLRLPVEKLVFEKKVPILGICVGMQMLANSSEEGSLPGLGWLNGCVYKLKDVETKSKIRLPHMGWNNATPLYPHPLFKSLEVDAQFYFLHSYFFEPEHSEDALAMVDYGSQFVCSVANHHVMGVQFHPEKSHSYGSKLLQNFAEF